MLSASVSPDPSSLFAPLAGVKRVGIAVSGGPDSLALMLMLSAWAKDMNRLADFVVYTVDHGLRPESADEAAFVLAEAQRVGLVGRVLRWDGIKPETGLQAAARAARYRLIGAAMTADKIDLLVTGHHLLDQAETVLMRLGHGSGIGGLGGMAMFANVAGVSIFRPLLDIAPDALAEIVKTAGRVAITDPSNLNQKFERVRVRAVLPALAELGLTPQRLGQFAARARRAEAALKLDVDGLTAQHMSADGFGHVTLALAAFMALGTELQVRLVQRALVAAGGAAKPFALSAVEGLVDNLLAGDFSKTTLHGAIIVRDDTQIGFAREAARMPQIFVPVEVGQTVIWDNRFRIHNCSSAPLQLSPALGFSRKNLLAEMGLDYAGPMYAVQTAPLIAAEDGAFLGIGTHVDANLVDAQFCGLTRS